MEPIPKVAVQGPIILLWFLVYISVLATNGATAADPLTTKTKFTRKPESLVLPGVACALECAIDPGCVAYTVTDGDACDFIPEGGDLTAACSVTEMECYMMEGYQVSKGRGMEIYT